MEVGVERPTALRMRILYLKDKPNFAVHSLGRLLNFYDFIVRFLMLANDATKLIE